MILPSPYPYMGGKSRICDIVWPRLGADVRWYIEPFLGSAAMLLGRPGDWGAYGTEVVNDADGFIPNFWRAVQKDPDAVADAAIQPCHELELHARHRWLQVQAQERDMVERLRADPDYYQPDIAGWWAWGLAHWIGGGWCFCNKKEKPHLGDDGQGLARKRPHLGDDGQGLARKIPHLGNDGRGLSRQRPHLGNDGQGLARQRLHLDDDQGLDDPMDRNGTREYLRALALRLRYVRVCCGDWERICTDGAMSHGLKTGSCAVFLDPPYASARNMVYAVDETDIVPRVQAWCAARGDDKRLRIVVCGYDGEYDLPGWEVVRWKAKACFQTSASAARGDGNMERRQSETLWLSPGCVPVAARQMSLWDDP